MLPTLVTLLVLEAMNDTHLRSSGPLIVDFAGTQLTPEDREILRHPATAGVILFSRNLEHSQQVQALCADLVAVRPDLLICIDQEGGRVQRLKNGVTRLPPMALLGQLFESDRQTALRLSNDTGWLMARELRALGVHLSFAPVLDMDVEHCAAIGDRSFGREAETVTALAATFIDGMNHAGMGAVGKHFPGHGSVITDSHYGLPSDDRTLDNIVNTDMRPFSSLCQSHLQGVMPAHIVFSQIDTCAVGFSTVWLQQVLRRQLQFTGLIFSDDLNMAAADSGGDYVDRSRAALAAGCDLLLLCNNRPAVEQVLNTLETDIIDDRVATLKRALIGTSPPAWTDDEIARRQRVRHCLETLDSEGTA